MGVKFLKDQCQKDFQDHMITTVKRMQDVYFNEVKSHMRTSEGANDLTESEVKAVAGWITAQVIGGPWATVDAFGTGSLMDMSNPALTNYLFNTAAGWNPDRHDTAIRTRKGPYTDIFGRTRKGSKVGGIYLEDREKYAPMPPSHAFTTAMAWMQIGTIQNMLKKAIAVFPFHKYIIVTTKR